jgi:hypothetical protein
MKERDCLHSYCKNHPNDAAAAFNLRLLKSRVKRCILKDTKYQLDAERGLWGGLKSVFPIENVPQLPEEMEPDKINNFFVSISQPDPSDNFHPLLPEKPHNLTTTQSNPFRFQHISESDLRKAWKSIKNPDSLSLDSIQICPKMLNISLQSDSSVKQLTHLFNTMITSETIPKPLKVSRVVPIPKITIPTSPNDLRPISVQPVITKLFEKCVLPQLSSHFERNRFLCKEQFGFRKHHSTSHALIGLTDLLYEGLAKNRVCLVVPLDFRNAFDKVDRNVLLHKIRWYNVDSKLIDSFLNERSQYKVELLHELLRLNINPIMRGTLGKRKGFASTWR